MSDIKYGLISKVDAATLEKTIDLVCDHFSDATINFCEVGIYAGRTGASLAQYINSKDRSVYSTGIDNKKDNEEIKYYYDNLIIGNSNEVYNQLEDESQHLIFVDACHCFSCVVSSFFCYADKVKVGGYMAWHDCGKHIVPFKDFQHGDEKNPGAYISVRKALERIGMFNDAGYDLHMSIPSQRYLGGHGFRLIFDEADSGDNAGGICCFKKK